MWGDFDAGLRALRDRLRRADPGQPLLDALREAVLAFNALDARRDAPGTATGWR